MIDEDTQTALPSRLLGISRAVRRAYTADPDRLLTNNTLYEDVAEQMELDLGDARRPEAIGRSGAMRSRFERQVRWTQQTMRLRGLLARSESKRGEWGLTEVGKFRLRRIDEGAFVVAFHTNLGVGIIGDCSMVFKGLPAEIDLVLTSPPYPLAKPRAYGNVDQSEYVDFICAAIEPLARVLSNGGSIVINVSNDIFEPGSPARSLYRERLLIALHDRLGLKKMDEMIWHNPSKAPGPVQWASVKRYQLQAGYEPLLWLCNNPHATYADNQQILLPHSERHIKYLAKAAREDGDFTSDGAYRKRRGSYKSVTDGRIPRNVLTFGHGCPGQRAYKSWARQTGLPVHGAPFPEAMVETLIRFLTREGMLVADPFSGSMTTAAVAERLGRRWIGTDIMADYVLGGMSRFAQAPGLWINPDISLV